ncbi:TPA: hypothetical protein QFP46_002518, partial [Enterococcus faecium]
MSDKTYVDKLMVIKLRKIFLLLEILYKEIKKTSKQYRNRVSLRFLINVQTKIPLNARKYKEKIKSLE